MRLANKKNITFLFLLHYPALFRSNMVFIKEEVEEKIDIEENPLSSMEYQCNLEENEAQR